MPPEPSTVVSDRVAALLADGELLAAYDLADSSAPAAVGLEQVLLDHAAVLALARMGATDRAEEEFLRRGLLDAAHGPDVPAALAEDLAALDARLAKDRALAGPLPDPTRCAKAAARYEQIFGRLGRPYSCINAATLWLLAGDRDRAATLAQAALGLVEASVEYWDLATSAEAHLILGDVPAADAALRDARASSGAGVSVRATTARQLRRICAALGIDVAVLDALELPSVVHFCGHLAGGNPQRWSTALEREVVAAVDRHLESRSVGLGVGALASGADIVVAERLLAAGASLHVVLPFDAEQFVPASVAPGGSDWVTRFHSCIEAATSVRVVSRTDAIDDPMLFGHASAVAMGDAVIRATELGVDVAQLAIWDGVERPGSAGTAADVRRWRHTARPSVTIELPDAGPAATAAPQPTLPGRAVCGILFADFRGYSRLTDRSTVRFVEHVLAVVADVVHQFDDVVMHVNRWGDGLHMIVADVVASAELAVRLQERLLELDMERLGLPADLGLRIGLHVAPVFAGADPVLGDATYFGTEVTRTARIEPRTPEGEVYVSDDFAAVVALDASERFCCDYVGRLPAVKDYGAFPMYLLRRTSTP